MNRRSRALLLSALLLSASGRADQASSGACRLECTALANQRFAVHAGSRVVQGSVLSGPIADASNSAALAVYDALERELIQLPVDLRPRRFDVHLTQGGASAIVADVPSTSLLVASPARITPPMWRHELLHLLARGARPTTPLAARVCRALEEGVADYFAAVTVGSPRISGESQRDSRDLTESSPPLESEWLALLLAAQPDVHQLGIKLAAMLWEASPDSLDLVRDLAVALGRSDAWLAGPDGPRTALEGLIRRTPKRSEQLLRRVLVRWAPEEFLGGGGAEE